MAHTAQPDFNYRAELMAELNRRKLMNPRYSLRAFARAIGFSPAFLSKLLRGEKNLSPERALVAGEKLGYSGGDLLQFVKMVQITNAGSTHLKAVLLDELQPMDEDRDFVPVGLEIFQVISDWYHYAILELSKCTGFKPAPHYIADRLGISVLAAREALARLKRLGLLREVRGALVKSDAFIATPAGIPSQAIRNFHSQMIHKAGEALLTQSIEKRDISGVTMAIRDEDLPAVRKEIKAFRRKIARLVETKQGQAVYQLNIQFFSLEHDEESK